ncbi:hypothetical protein AB6Q56_14665 [Dechloromonas sp. ARDL1]|uniref:hypothetical protein n=1 Tax=Dechloromonas sp. ARDL1 TaxID=3322121 RepID=UPI003DA6E2C7
MSEQARKTITALSELCERYEKQIATLNRQRDLAVEALEKSREALQFANDSPGGGIVDTIWMMHSPETLFDFMDATISTIKESDGK